MKSFSIDVKIHGHSTIEVNAESLDEAVDIVNNSFRQDDFELFNSKFNLIDSGFGWFEIIDSNEI